MQYRETRNSCSQFTNYPIILQKNGNRDAKALQSISKWDYNQKYQAEFQTTQSLGVSWNGSPSNLQQNSRASLIIN